MTRTPTTLLALTLVVACDPTGAGTQIGSEDDLHCDVVSTEEITDPHAVPEGFDHAPSTIIGGLTGAFQGAQLDEQEQPTVDQASLQVVDAGEPIVLTRFTPSGNDGGGPEQLGICTPVLTVRLDFAMEADGLPAVVASLDAFVRHEGDVWAESSDPAWFASELPAPTSFDARAFDEVVPSLVFSGLGEAWWATVSWEAWNFDEIEEDGDRPITRELVMMAALQSQ